MEKWISALAPKENMGTDAVAQDIDNGPVEVGTNASKQKKMGTKQIPGKYTAKKNGRLQVWWVEPYWNYAVQQTVQFCSGRLSESVVGTNGT